jgi:DNA-binding NarL/FixJ family response regulator
VLIVDDHQLLATTLAVALRQRGVHVDASATWDPGELAATVRRLAPVLVLLDLDLGPEARPGVDLVRPLIDAGGRVVMMTGVLDRVRLAACVEAGAVGIVGKAAGFDGLVDTVRRAADGEALLTLSEREDLLRELHTARRADQDRAAPFLRLSPREQAVLTRLAAGDSAETIAAHSYVSLATVRSQIRAVLAKLGVSSQLAAVALARSADWPWSGPLTDS